MDITVLPETESTHIIKENFLLELSLWVDLTGNASSQPIQCLIFKPAGRPLDEIHHVIETFETTGKQLDDLIFITATAPDRSIFNAPAKFNFAFKTCIFLTEKNEIHPKSNDALAKLADFLIHKNGFKRQLRGKKGKDSQTTDNTRRQEKEIKRLTKEVERLQQKVHELEHSKTKVLSRHAVEEEIANIDNELYDFQREYEKKNKQEPGKLRKVLEFIPREWKNVSGNGLTIEGDGLQCLISMVNDTFQLPPDRFKKLLKAIYERNDKGKGRRRPSYRENTALDIDHETYAGYGATHTTV